MRHWLESRRRLPGGAGYSYVELLVVCVVLVILAGVSFPLARHSLRSVKERELRAALRQMRSAIDDYKRFSDAGLLPIEFGTEGYPTDFEVLVEGVELVGDASGKKHRFLRRIPIDPMTGSDEWGKRCFQDDWDSQSWCGENLYDVYSDSSSTGLNEIPYSEW